MCVAAPILTGETSVIALLDPSPRGAGRHSQILRVAEAFRLASPSIHLSVCRPQDIAFSTSHASIAGRRLTALLAFPHARSHIPLQALRRAVRRGVVTNAPGAFGALGCKDLLEYALCAHGRLTGHSVPRPETYVLPGALASLAVASLHRRGLPAIIKPANGARAEGVEVLPPGAAAAPRRTDETVVVQALAREPLLVTGRKADLRVYCVVTPGRARAARRIGPTLVRVAPAPYRCGAMTAEVTNTSYRRRLGLPPAIHPMEAIPELAPIRGATLGLIETLVDDVGSLCRPDGGRPRAMLWGLDVLPHFDSGRLELLLLEINVYPLLFRGDPLCDDLVRAMLGREYLPLLLERAQAIP